MTTNTIAETPNYIVLENYEKIPQPSGEYQSEADLEREFMQDLIHQGYENPQHLTTPKPFWQTSVSSYRTSIMLPFLMLSGSVSWKSIWINPMKVL